MKFASVLLLSFLSGAAFADGPNPVPAQPGSQASPGASRAVPDEFSKLDVNHDGELSKAELAKHPKAAHMAMVDENQDGFLSREEFEQLQGM